MSQIAQRRMRACRVGALGRGSFRLFGQERQVGSESQRPWRRLSAIGGTFPNLLSGFLPLPFRCGRRVATCFNVNSLLSRVSACVGTVLTERRSR